MYCFRFDGTYVQFHEKNLAILNVTYLKICFHKLYFSKIDINFQNIYFVIMYFDFDTYGNIPIVPHGID